MEPKYDIKICSIIIFLIAIIAYGLQAFNLTLAGDDWQISQIPMGMELWSIFIGRWGTSLVWNIFFGNQFAPAVTLFTMVGLLLLSAVFHSKLYQVKNNTEFITFTSLLVFSPILAEPLNFKMAHLPLGIAIFFCTIAFYIIVRQDDFGNFFFNKKIIRAVSSLILLTVSISTYQPIVLFFITLTMCYAVHHTINNQVDRKIVQLFIKLFLLGLFSILFSLLISKLLIVHLNLSGDQFFSPQVVAQYAPHLISNLDELKFTLNRFFEYFLHFIFKEQHLWPQEIKFLFIIIVLVWLILIFKKVPKRTAAISCLLLAVCGIFISPWVLGIVRTPENAYRYNALIGIIFIYPFVYVSAYTLSKNRFLKKIILVFSSITIFSFVYFQNVANLATYTTNMRDFFTASRILSRIESDKNFSADSLKKIIILGQFDVDIKKLNQTPPFSGHTVPGPMGTSIISCGVFNGQPGRFKWIMPFISYRYRGLRIEFLNTKDFVNSLFSLDEFREQKDKLNRFITGLSVWPSHGSVHVFKDFAVIVFSKSFLNELKGSIDSQAGLHP